MAKKTIISDFSALKGKVTFSEQGGILDGELGVKGGISGKTGGRSEGNSKRDVGQVDSVKLNDLVNDSDNNFGNALKVGQKVVLMDSDLRGRIVSLGRTVKIELEEGLVIKAAYGEFAITHEDEISALKQSKVIKSAKANISSKISASKKITSSKPSSNALEVDLHIEVLPEGRNVPKGQQLEYQMEIFKKVIRENAHHRGRTITFIHGVGDGILKAAIRKELDEVLALRCSYSVGDPAVTVVSIR